MVEATVLKMNNIKCVLKRTDLLSGRLRLSKATYHRIELNLGTRPIQQQPYRSENGFRDILFGIIERKLEAAVIELAQLAWDCMIELVLKER